MWTAGFVMVCAATFLGYAQVALLTPTLPLFIVEQGGTASLVGIVTAAFSVTSFAFRPFIGRAVDTWSARGVMAIGTVLLGLSSLGYLVYNIALLLVVRSLHGLGWAAYNTGVKVLVAAAPAERRGEATGYFALSQGLATAVFPAVALWLLGYVGFAGIFLISAVAGLLATCAALVRAEEPKRRAHKPGPVRKPESFWAGLVEPSAAVPSVLEFLLKAPHPAATVFVPLYAAFRGISAESLFIYYLAYGIVSIASRGVMGRLSDGLGRGWMIAMGSAASIGAFLLMAVSGDIVLLTVGGVLFGLASAAYGPAIMALTIDLSRPERRGAAIATYSMAFQMAQGAGSLVCGFVADMLGFQAMYLVMVLPPLAGLGIVIKHWRTASVAASAS